ncbi:glycoside hydrolase [Irpex rosettiformis]|uniref:Glycoside hydrolase n=1 Tax=Irpex rosettiformis TaxID=378272 RepID=A0ACB8UJR6_9APHY|nr:glycoside hydrolase [Irpex rosettiformis]
MITLTLRSVLSLFAAKSVLDSAPDISSPPNFVPAVHSFRATGNNAFYVPSNLHVIVDTGNASSTQDDGLTLIPPSLHDFAQTFASDLQELFPRTSAAVSLGSETTLNRLSDYVFLTLGQNSNHTLADGSSTTEGYELQVTARGVKVNASGPKGAFWGTRTLLQGLVLTNGQFPASVINDQPDWRTRGLMLDVGRHWYPIDFLKEVCAYASWFKMSEFHVHLSDNVNPRGHPDAYARFRLWTDNPAFAGLVPFKNETYSRTEFDDLQQTCAKRGITIIPEIESPGHALVITQWKPELALSTDITLLNITYPETIPTVKSIWKGIIPPMVSQQYVSIGADEYDSDLADDYNLFVNTMSDFIAQESSKTIRIWGTNEPSNKTSVDKNIIQQHWDFGQDDPFSLIRSGWEVINSEDSFQYIVTKDPPTSAFPPQLNQTRLWDGANVGTGGIWDPHVFDRGNASNNPVLSDPRVAGAIMAVWNDHGPNATTPLEAFYCFKEGLPVVLSANWQAASRPGHLTHEQFLAAYPKLEANAPGQNLDRRIASKSQLVARYNPSSRAVSGAVKDTSGNGYDAQPRDGVLHTPLSSKGHNYTILLSLRSPELPVTGSLLSGPDTSFGLAASSNGNGTTLAFTSYNIVYPLFNFSLPATSSTSPELEIILLGTENSTSAYVDRRYAGDFVIALDGTTVFQPMAFVAPVQQITVRNANSTGMQLNEFAVWDGLQNVSEISRMQ